LEIRKKKLDSINDNLCPKLPSTLEDKDGVVSVMGYIILYYLSPWQSGIHESLPQIYNGFDDRDEINRDVKTKSEAIEVGNRFKFLVDDVNVINNKKLLTNYHPFYHGLNNKLWKFDVEMEDCWRYWCQLLVRYYIKNEEPGWDYKINRRYGFDNNLEVDPSDYCGWLSFKCYEMDSFNKDYIHKFQNGDYWSSNDELDVSDYMENMIILPGLVEIKKWYHFNIKSHRSCECTQETHSYDLFIGELDDNRNDGDKKKFVVWKNKYEHYYDECYPDSCWCPSDIDEWNIWP